MLRMYLIILFVVGVGASLLGRLPQQSSSAARESVTVPFPSAASNSSATGGQSVNEMDRSIELTRDANGYFYADVQINGAPVHMVVDTGATVIALSRNDAQMAGLATSIGMNDVIGQGADGVVKGEQVTLDRVTLGAKTVEAVPAIVLSNGGQSLLGQSFLSKFASVKIEGDKMVLR
jgi:aspartyl protease family protein